MPSIDRVRDLGVTAAFEASGLLSVARDDDTFPRRDFDAARTNPTLILLGALYLFNYVRFVA